MASAAILGIAKAAEPQAKAAEPLAETDGQQAEPSFKFRKLASLPTRNQDDFAHEIEQTGTVYGMKFSPDGKWFFAKTGKNLTICNRKRAS